MKKIFAILLSLVLFLHSLLFFNIAVYASEEETTEETGILDGFLKLVENDVNAVGNSVCAVLGVVGDYTNNEFLVDIVTNRLYQTGYLKDVNGETYVCECIPPEVLAEIRDLLKEYIEQEEPYEIYGTHTDSTTRGVVERLTTNMKPSSAYALQSYFNQYYGNTISGNIGGNWMGFGVLDSSMYMYAYRDKNSGCVRFVDKDLMPAYCVKGFRSVSGGKLNPQELFTLEDVEYGVQAYNTTCDGYLTSTGSVCDNSFRFLINGRGTLINGDYEEHYVNWYFGTPLVVFDDSSALAEWILDNPICFTGSNFNNVTFEPLTINPTNINKYDDELMNKIYTELCEVKKNVVTAQELQKIIDDTVTKHLKAINENLSDIEEVSKETNTILTNIYNQDKDFYTDFLGFKTSILDDLKSIVDYVATGNKSLAQIEKNSDKMLDKLDALIGISTLDLLNDVFGDEEPGESIGTISNTFTFTELFKSKFPFSMPWDLYALFCLFEADPVCPDFKIPLRLNIYNLEEVYEIPVNGADWEYISYLSRSLHTVLFCAYLYKFTLKFIVKK